MSKEKGLRVTKLSEMNVETVKKIMESYKIKLSKNPESEEIKRKLTQLTKRYNELSDSPKVTSTQDSRKELTHTKDATFWQRLLAIFLDSVIGILSYAISS